MKSGRAPLLACAGVVAWYLYQRRWPMPLPPVLSFVLENPVTERFVGTDVLLPRLHLGPGLRVLDAGCGPGRLAVPIAKLVEEDGRVVALDSQPAMLERLQTRSDTENLTNVRPLLAGLGEGALPESYFDRAVLAMVLGEVRDKGAAMRELYAALRPGGILSVTEAVGDPDYRRPATIRREAEAAGFRLIEKFGGFPAYTLNFEKPSTPEQSS